MVVATFDDGNGRRHGELRGAKNERGIRIE